jgi:hypothetical protein
LPVSTRQLNGITLDEDGATEAITG